MEGSKLWAAQHQSDYLWLSVLPDNKDAQRFYSGFGLNEQMITMECSLHD